MVNYNNSKIYKLWSDQSDCFYIGSTTQPLNKRFNNHMTRMREGKRKIAELMRQHTNIRAELIENYPCSSKEELYAREGHHIRLHRKQLLNTYIPDRTKSECDAEYRKSHKEEIAEWKRLHYEINKEKILAHNAEYRRANKEKKAANDAIYAAANREKINARIAIWREANKDRINAKRRAWRAAKKASTSSSSDAALV